MTSHYFSDTLDRSLAETHDHDPTPPAQGSTYFCSTPLWVKAACPWAAQGMVRRVYRREFETQRHQNAQDPTTVIGAEQEFGWDDMFGVRFSS